VLRPHHDREPHRAVALSVAMLAHARGGTRVDTKAVGGAAHCTPFVAPANLGGCLQADFGAGEVGGQGRAVLLATRK
jgi:hypothetical protein